MGKGILDNILVGKCALNFVTRFKTLFHNPQRCIISFIFILKLSIKNLSQHQKQKIFSYLNLLLSRKSHFCAGNKKWSTNYDKI